MTSGILALIALIAGFGIGYFLRPKSEPALAPVVPIASSALQQRASALTKEQETVDASGEYKRHIVYAQLIKEFPAETKRNIAKAIESVL